MRVAAFLGSLILASGAQASDDAEQFVSMALGLCANAGSSPSVFEARAAAVPGLKLSEPKPLAEKFGDNLSAVPRVLGVKPDQPIRLAWFEPAAGEALGFVRPDGKACVATQRGDGSAGKVLISRLEQPGSGWEEIIGMAQARSWQRPIEGGPITTLMVIRNSTVSLAGVTLDLAQMPRLVVYDKVAGVVVPQCLASLMQNKPLDSQRLTPYFTGGKPDTKGNIVMTQSELPHVRVVLMDGTPGCLLVPSIPSLSGDQIMVALAQAFLAQPGAEELPPNPDKRQQVRAWRIRNADAYLTIVLKPQFIARFSRTPD